MPTTKLEKMLGLPALSYKEKRHGQTGIEKYMVTTAPELSETIKIAGRVMAVLGLPVLLFFQGAMAWSQSAVESQKGTIAIADSLGRRVTIKKPVRRIIALGNYRLEALKVLGASDKVMGIDTDAKKNSAYYFPVLKEKPDVGTWKQPNHEIIVGLYPDLVITSANPHRVRSLEEKLTPFGITLVGFDFYRENCIEDEIKKLGSILDRTDKVGQYLEWRRKYEKKITQYVSGLTPEDKPKVFMEWGKEPGNTWGKGSSGQAMCAFVGGNNIASQCAESALMSVEWVVAQNPQVIIKCINMPGNKWGWSHPGEPQKIIDQLKKRPGLHLTDAVKNNRVHVYASEIAWGLDSIVAAAYWTKWFHPDMDIDPENIYREYTERFLNIAYPENRIFAYPPPRSTSTPDIGNTQM